MLERLKKLVGMKDKEMSPLGQAIVHAAVMSAEQTRSADERKRLENFGANLLLAKDLKIEDSLTNLARLVEQNPQDPAVDFDLLALQNLNSPLIRLSMLDETLMKMVYLKTRILRRRIKIPQDSPDSGAMMNYVESFDPLTLTAVADAKDGMKAKLLKVEPRTMQIEMRETKGK